MTEIWKDVKGYEGLYQISNLGRIKRYADHRIKKDIFMKRSIVYNGYYRVGLSKNFTCIHHRVGRLVAIAFIDNPNNYPQVNHIDGNKLNDRVDNLEWVTRKENMRHAKENGLMPHGSKNRLSKLNELQVRIIRRASKYFKQKELAGIFNISGANVSSIVRRKTWTEV